MKNRFTRHSSISTFYIKFMAVLLLFFLIVVLFLSGIQNIEHMTATEEADSLNSAIERSIVHCYAVEGSYPESLDYLISHYGITYDHDRFFVDYQAIGQNIMPDVTVVVLGGAS